MKSGKLLVAMGAVFLLMDARSASAAPLVHAKANSTSGTVHAAIKLHPQGAVKSDGKRRGQKRTVHHDAQLDYQQPGYGFRPAEKRVSAILCHAVPRHSRYSVS